MSTNPNKSEQQVIVSLTSFPAAIPYASQAVQSILDGTVLPDKVVLYLTFSQFEKDSIPKELTDLETLFRNITGKELPKYYRPPQGIYSEENLKQAHALGYRTIFWSLAYVDWLEENQPEPVYNVTYYGILPDSGDVYEGLYNLIKDHVSDTGGVVYFPPGKYTITNTIFVPEGTTFRGAGPESEK